MSLAKFFELTEVLYSMHESQSYPELQWTEFESLLVHLEGSLTQKIPEELQYKFIEFLLKYIEMSLSFLSTFTITQYTSQIKYSSRLLYFLPDALNSQKLCSLFIATNTGGIFNLLIYINFSTFAKRSLLFMFNRNLEKCNQETKEATGTENVSYIYKLIDLLPTYGDYSLQCDVLETVFRLYPHLIKSKQLKYSILPEMPELSEALFTDISPNTFDSDIRAWLSKFNKNSPHIFSIEARKVTLGNVLCIPHQADVIWLDFNLKDQVLSFSTATGVNNCEWNLLYIPVQYVKSIEVHKPQPFLETEKTTALTVILSKPCISANNQSYWNAVGKTLEIVISEEKNEQTSRLISHVLPRMFGRIFKHRSSIRRSITLKKIQKRVYRPLMKRELSRSRSSQEARTNRKGSTHSSCYVSGSDSSGSVEFTEKSSFDGQLNITSKIGLKKCSNTSTNTVAVDQKLTKSGPTDDCPEKFSYGPTESICSNSSVAITIFSRTDSNAVTSRPVTPALDRIESLQDNIVTSSNMFEDEIIASSADIPLGQSKNRLLPSINDSVDFQPSELFSSSPFHRSLNTQEFLENVTTLKKEDFEVAALTLAQFDLDASQSIEKKSSFIMKVDESSGKQSIIAFPKTVKVDSVKQFNIVDEKHSVAINTNFETAVENQIYVEDLSCSKKEFEVAQRLTQFELNTEPSEQQPVNEYTNEKLVDNKRSLVQLNFKSTNSEFETAIEGSDYSLDNLSKTEKRSLVQIHFKENTKTAHDTGSLEYTDAEAVDAKLSLDQEKLKATNTNFDKAELRNEDVAYRLTQFELNSQNDIEGCHPVDAIASSQQPVTDKIQDVNQEVKSMTQKSSDSQTKLTDMKTKILPQITEEGLSTVNGSQDVMAHESINDSQSFHLSPLKGSEEAAKVTEVFDQKLVSSESSQSFELSAPLKLIEEAQKVQFKSKLLRVNLMREPLIKILTEKMDSEVSSETASPSQKLTQSNSFIPSGFNETKCVIKDVCTQFETVAKRLTQFQLDCDSQLEKGNMVEQVEHLMASQKPENLKDIGENLVKDSIVTAEDMTLVPQDLTSNKVEETVEQCLTPDFDKTTQDLFAQFSPDTQTRHTVESAEEASEAIFHLQTQDITDDLSLKVNVGVFTNESAMDKNVLHFPEVESAVEEIFIDLTKDEVAEMDVLEDRHLSTQELLTVLDKTVSQKSLNALSDLSTVADAHKPFLFTLDALLDIHSTKVIPAVPAKPEDPTVQKPAAADKEQSQDKEVSPAAAQPTDSTVEKLALVEVKQSQDQQEAAKAENRKILKCLSSETEQSEDQKEDKPANRKIKKCPWSEIEQNQDQNEVSIPVAKLQDTYVQKCLSAELEQSQDQKEVSTATAKRAEITVQKKLLAEIEPSQDQKKENGKMQKDMDKITLINSPLTKEPKFMLEQSELKPIVNYNDPNASNNAVDILKRVINFFGEENKAEENSLAENNLEKKPKKDKHTKKETKPKKCPPRTLFDQSNLAYMDTLNWSTPDYESGSSHNDYEKSAKGVKRRTRTLKNKSTQNQTKKHKNRKQKKIKIESSMQGLVTFDEYGTIENNTPQPIKVNFPILKKSRKRTFSKSFSKFDSFIDVVARDMSDIPASKPTVIQTTSDSSPLFTDHSTASSQKFPELEIEPIGFNSPEQRQYPNIKVLQDILIKQPTHFLPVAESSPKRLKLNEDNDFSSVNVPSEQPVLDTNLMHDAWKAMHKITTWILQCKETNVEKVVEFINSLPHEE